MGVSLFVSFRVPKRCQIDGGGRASSFQPGKFAAAAAAAAHSVVSKDSSRVHAKYA